MAVFTVDNTRGMNVQVFCNGRKVERAYWANTGKGIVRTYTNRVDKWRKRVIEKTYRGRVRVLLPDGSPATPMFDARQGGGRKK